MPQTYEAPLIHVTGCFSEGVLCMSPTGVTENYTIHDETDW